MEMMTHEEWKKKKETDRIIKIHLERARQQEFAQEQLEESVFTRPSKSIIDPEN